MKIKLFTYSGSNDTREWIFRIRKAFMSRKTGNANEKLIAVFCNIMSTKKEIEYKSIVKNTLLYTAET